MNSYPSSGGLSVAPIIIVLGLAALILLSRFRLNQEYERAAVFRIGRSAGIRGPGLFWLWPFIDRSMKVDIRTIVRQFSEQELITKDGLTVKINFVMWCRIVDAQKAIVQVADWVESVGQAAETAMRDTVGQNTLDQILKDRQTVNRLIQDVLGSVTQAWGVEVQKVEIKDIDIPENMQRAIAREAEAVREKTARVIKAEGELEAARRLREAAEIMASSPSALELRRLQTISEVGIEHNSVIVLALPMESMHNAAALAAMAGKHAG